LPQAEMNETKEIAKMAIRFFAANRLFIKMANGYVLNILLFFKDLYVPAETFVEGDEGFGSFDAFYLL
jgi:hypothetical protein